VALPIQGGKITTAYRKKGKHWSKGYHTGVDFAQPVGTPVYAVQGGTVTKANWGKAYGTQIVIDQDALNDGTPQRIAGGWAIYAHLSKSNVIAGQRVEKGDLIGYVGNTGNSTGPHLHFEVRNNIKWSAGTERDPMPFINA
jgi:murein DD-endopeptidase MepM/ murein hydrolase activator NlpD